MTERVFAVVRKQKPHRAHAPTRYLCIFDPSGEFVWPTDPTQASKFTLYEAALFMHAAQRDEPDMEFELENSL